MSKKRNLTVAVVAVIVVCAVVLALSSIIDWPIDQSGSKGDIAKSSRFSKKTVNIENTNMQELLANDEEYKSNVVVSYAVMQTRASQFNALVDMSVEVAGDKKEFESVLTDMKAVKPLLNNVLASMQDAGNSLNTALSGEKSKDLSQNTSNAALAYQTLQKQNSLADRFIESADEYVKNASADDRLKLVRDEWVEYQIMTATLDGDETKCNQLVESGYMLNSQDALAALCSFEQPMRLVMEDVQSLQTAIGYLQISTLKSLETISSLKFFNMENVANSVQKMEMQNHTVMTNNDIIASYGSSLKNLETSTLQHTFSATLIRMNENLTANAVNQTLKDSRVANQHLSEMGPLNESMKDTKALNFLTISDYLNQNIVSTITGFLPVYEMAPMR